MLELDINENRIWTSELDINAWIGYKCENSTIVWELMKHAGLDMKVRIEHEVRIKHKCEIWEWVWELYINVIIDS